ncbi:MAG: sigma-70 family RNA polymerase sigma factor [Proteobacteria bacterium]|nr:sigma-70 family RNA polymerase sigma factor [Pseudomonadota bacterium]
MGKLLPFADLQHNEQGQIPLEKRDDDELMLLARGGKNEAFDEIVRRHQQMVSRIAIKYLGNVSLARDVTQNSFVELYRFLPKYRAQRRFISFLNRIVINQCRMVARSRDYERKALLEFSGQPSPTSTMPEDQLLARERRRDVERALKSLSPKLREVLILRFTGELSYKEIAETLGLRLGTVKSRIFSGLKNMNRLLENSDR